MSEQSIVKVLDPGRVPEVLKFLAEAFTACDECGDFFDGEGRFCSPNCDLAYHSDPNAINPATAFPELYQ